MYSPAYERQACKAGYVAWQTRGPGQFPGYGGYAGSPRLRWCWYTGYEAAKTKQSLEAAFHTLTIPHTPRVTVDDNGLTQGEHYGT